MTVKKLQSKIINFELSLKIGFQNFQVSADNVMCKFWLVWSTQKYLQSVGHLNLRTIVSNICQRLKQHQNQQQNHLSSLLKTQLGHQLKDLSHQSDQPKDLSYPELSCNCTLLLNAINSFLICFLQNTVKMHKMLCYQIS